MTRNSSIIDQHKKEDKWVLEGAKNDLQHLLDGYEEGIDYYTYTEVLNYVFNIIDTVAAATKRENDWFYKNFFKEDTNDGKH